MISNNERAQILNQALPHIKKVNNKTIVIKYGGSTMNCLKLKENIIKDIILLKFIGAKPIIVHGGGPAISEYLKQLNIPSSFSNGLRVTNKKTMEIVEMVLSGNISKEIVSLINTHGGNAVSLSGKDGSLIKAKKINHTDNDIGFVGEITDINTEIIKLLEIDYIPVISPVGFDNNGNSYNINADYVASKIAQALNAYKLILMTNVDGIYAKSDFLTTLDEKTTLELIENKTIEGGMLPKVESCLNALNNGVEKVHIINGEVEHSLLLELFTDEGIGTMFKTY